MTKIEERRRFTRIEFDGKTSLAQDDKRFPGNLLDVSLKGALIEIPKDQPLAENLPLSLFIELGDITIEMKAEYAHRNPGRENRDQLGLHCVSIDMESMTHLRRLIELNLEDPHASERVLDELISA